ncbi:MAG: sialidase family protein, partial [Gemmatimonadota bacterium]
MPRGTRTVRWGGGDQTRSAGRRAAALLFPAVLLASAVACGGEGESAAPVFREISSPAEPGSSAAALRAGARGALLTWIEATGDGGSVVYLARWHDGGWEERREIARGDDLHVDWADVPSVLEAEEGRLVAQWLVRGPRGGYGLRTAHSSDGGRTWSEPRTPHADASPVEHGFATLLDLGDGRAGIVWLDGRGAAEGGADSDSASSPSDDDPADVALRFRRLGPGSDAEPEAVVDPRTCECCPTDAAPTSDGWLVVYRDRSPGEVRDIHRIRLVDGRWGETAAVHDDEWVFGACPVNGPAVASDGSRVAVAWFTGVDGEPRVRLAFSDDAGRTFGSPVRIDDGWAGGRVDVVLADDGGAYVSWVERVGGEGEVRVRRVGP